MQHPQPRPSLDELKQLLKQQGINFSYQRLKVLEYMLNNEGHPSVDEIYCYLKEDIDTLSKTTVYNTLKILVKAGIVRAVTIENYEVRYDIIIQPHGHFRCDKCRRIFNVDVDLDSINFNLPDNFQLIQKDIYFNGVCADCASKEN